MLSNYGIVVKQHKPYKLGNLNCDDALDISGMTSQKVLTVDI